MFLHIDLASEKDFTPPSEPSITGKPNFLQFFLLQFCPIFEIISALGPINLYHVYLQFQKICIFR